MIWLCLYLIGCIIVFVWLWNHRLKEFGRITLSDLTMIILMSIVFIFTLLEILILESDNIVIYKRNEKK